MCIAATTRSSFLKKNTLHILKNMDSEVCSLKQEHLSRLASQPNTDVLKVEYDSHHQPWKANNVKHISNLIYKYSNSEETRNMDAFKFRKHCLNDTTILDFQRKHPKMFWVLTDRELMKNTKYQKAISELIDLRSRIDNKTLTDGQEADALATKVVMQALGDIDLDRMKT